MIKNAVRSEDLIISESLTQDFCLYLRRSNRRIAGYATVVTTKNTNKKTSQYSDIIKSSLLIVATLVFFASCAFHPANSKIVHYYQVETSKPYDDVLAELKIAIAEHNFRITGHSRVGKVIRDRGTIPFPEYDTLQFCNLSHAKTLLLMSPHSVSYMPCNIVIYQFDNQTIIKTQLLPTATDNKELNQFSEKMNHVLRQIVDFAAEE